MHSRRKSFSRLVASLFYRPGQDESGWWCGLTCRRGEQDRFKSRKWLERYRANSTGYFTPVRVEFSIPASLSLSFPTTDTCRAESRTIGSRFVNRDRDCRGFYICKHVARANFASTAPVKFTSNLFYRGENSWVKIRFRVWMTGRCKRRMYRLSNWAKFIFFSI